jgi:hypothetical protein
MCYHEESLRKTCMMRGDSASPDHKNWKNIVEMFYLHNIAYYYNIIIMDIFSTKTISLNDLLCYTI